MKEENPRIVFGKFLKRKREEAGFTEKSFAYQMDLSNAEYHMLEYGQEMKYMTLLRSSIAPYLLHFNDIVEEKLSYQKLYKEAVTYQNEEDKKFTEKYFEPISEILHQPTLYFSTSNLDWLRQLTSITSSR